MRNGVKYLDNENILFAGGNYLVVEDIREKKQRVFQEHKSRVVTFGLVGESLVVSGSVDGEVLLWERRTMCI